MKIDMEQVPPLFKVSETHYAATWLLPSGCTTSGSSSCGIERMKDSQVVVIMKAMQEDSIMAEKLLEIKNLKQYFNVGKQMKFVRLTI